MKRWKVIMVALFLLMLMAGCGKHEIEQDEVNVEIEEDEMGNTGVDVVPTKKILELEDGFSSVSYEGNYGFDSFLSSGGATSDGEVVEFLVQNLLGDMDIGIVGDIFGCSTIATQNADGETIFGRNFDWNSCEAMVVMSYPDNGYASISTSNMDFITQGIGGGVAAVVLKSDEVKTIAALYAPLDGMNEKGLAVSVNMIQDFANIQQNTDKPDITTTTAIRLLLDKAGSVEEAITLLEQYDLHGSMGMMVHFAIADATGRSVVVEYIENEMVVTDTPAVTNFYLSEGEKYGIGTEQSHERYEILMNLLDDNQTMDELQVRDALDSVSKDNFGEFESTEWSIVYNLKDGKATYYHREDYTHGFVFTIE